MEERWIFLLAAALAATWIILTQKIKGLKEEGAQLKNQMGLLQNRLSGYSRFFPEQMVALLEKQDVTEVQEGDQTEVEAGVVLVHSRKFNDLARFMEGEELYGMINRIYQGMIPAVSRHGGIIEQMMESGLRALFVSGGLPALRSAVSICEHVNQERMEGEILPVFCIAVTYGRIRVGIVGQKERVCAAAISDIMALSGFLAEIGEKYGARILVTEAAAKTIPDFEHIFHTRLIGEIYVKLTNSTERIYDVYDGDVQEERRLKNDTREWFREAVENYRESRFYEARELFARVLRHNRFDRAAREYIYRCDKYYQEKEPPADLYLECC